MKNKNKRVLRRWLYGAVLTLSCQMLAPPAFANGDTEVASAASAAGQPVVLSDKVHSLTATLDDPTTVHEYRFQALRGQHVLIATPKAVDYYKLWQVQYQVDGGQWRTKSWAAESLNDLTPGAQVTVRVQAVAGARFDKLEYQLVFGSRPYMSYDLPHDPSIVRIPLNSSTKGHMPLVTQVAKKMKLEASFIDNKGSPVQGAVISLFLSEPFDKMSGNYVSDVNGKVSETFELKECKGGSLVRYSIDSRNTWKAEYNSGWYHAENPLIEQLANKYHSFEYVSICKQYRVWQPKY